MDDAICDDLFGEDPYGVMYEMLEKKIEEGSKSYINTQVFA